MLQLRDMIFDWEALDTQQRKDLEEYQQTVDVLSSGDDKKNFEFNNKDSRHAAIVMSTLFAKSKESIQIFCESFKGDVNKNPIYRKTLEEAILRGVKVEVIFEQSPNINSEAFKLLHAYSKSGTCTISLSILNNEYVKKLKNAHIDLGNFAIGDNSMYRYETDKSNFQAVCNFDDKKTVNDLRANFAILALNAQSIA